MTTPKATPHDSTRRSIFFIDFTEADGVRHRKTVRCPSWEKDPGASLIGLQARFAELTLDATIVRSSVSTPENPRHLKVCEKRRAENARRKEQGIKERIPGKCECFPRWTEIEELKP